MFVNMYLEVICRPSAPSLWLPNNCTWFSHPFWRFKGCFCCCCCFPSPKQMLFSALNNLQKARFGWPVTQTAEVQVGRGCGEKPGWASTELIKSLTWLSTIIAPLCFISLRKAVGKWHSLTQAVLNSLCASDLNKGLTRPSGCPATGQLHPHGIEACQLDWHFCELPHTISIVLRMAHKTEITREAPTRIHRAFSQTLQCLEFFLKHQP